MGASSCKHDTLNTEQGASAKEPARGQAAVDRAMPKSFRARKDDHSSAPTAQEGVRYKGTVDNWNAEKGYGFIKPQDGGKNMFCHKSALQRGDMLKKGDSVVYEVKYNSSKGDWQAHNVEGGIRRDIDTAAGDQGRSDGRGRGDVQQGPSTSGVRKPGYQRIAIFVLCDDKFADEVVSGFDEQSTTAFPSSIVVAYSKGHLYKERYDSHGHGRVEALVKVPLSVLSQLAQKARTPEEVIDQVLPKEPNGSPQAEVRKRMHESIPDCATFPWMLNADFLKHVLPRLPTGANGNQQPTCILSTVERPHAEFGYKHSTLVGTLCYGAVKPIDFSNDPVETLIHAARREAMEQTGILLPRKFFEPVIENLENEFGQPLALLPVRLPSAARAVPANMPTARSGNEIRLMTGGDVLKIPTQRRSKSNGSYVEVPWWGERYIDIECDGDDLGVALEKMENLSIDKAART